MRDIILLLHCFVYAEPCVILFFEDFLVYTMSINVYKQLYTIPPTHRFL